MFYIRSYCAFEDEFIHETVSVTKWFLTGTQLFCTSCIFIKIVRSNAFNCLRQ